MTAQTHADVLYPPGVPFDAGWLDVGDGHSIYYEQCGRPGGVPVLFLHGGPGSGCSPRQRRLFDPVLCRAVLFDQRGCGRSTPRGQVRANTSDDLIADIERLRAHLGLHRWLVVGGSWGAGLGLAYATAHPEACAGLILRAIFLGRPEDIDWFFLGAAMQQPLAWEALRLSLPAGAANQHPLRALHDSLHGAQRPRALRCALAWQAWEAALDRATPVAPPDMSTADALIDKYRIQSHYLIHGCFWGERPLLTRAPALGNMPVTLIHGTTDAVCRPEATRALRHVLPQARAHWVADCGHSPFMPAMARALDTALHAMATPLEHAP